MQDALDVVLATKALVHTPFRHRTKSSSVARHTGRPVDDDFVVKITTVFKKFIIFIS